MKILRLIFLFLLLLPISCAEKTSGYTIVNHDKMTNTLTIKLDEQLLDGTDSSSYET